MIPGSQLCYLGVNYDTGESIMLPRSQLWYRGVNYVTWESIMIPGSQLCYLGVNYDTGESIMLPGSQLWYLRVNYDTEESQLVISVYLRLFFKVSEYLYRGTEGILYNNQNVKKVINEDYIFTSLISIIPRSQNLATFYTNIFAKSEPFSKFLRVT